MKLIKLLIINNIDNKNIINFEYKEILMKCLLHKPLLSYYCMSEILQIMSKIIQKLSPIAIDNSLWLPILQYIKFTEYQKDVISCLIVICKLGPDTIQDLIQSQYFPLLLDHYIYNSYKDIINNLFSLILNQEYSDSMLLYNNIILV